MAFYDTPGLFYDSGALYDDASASQPTGKRMAKVKVGLRGLSREQIADKLNTVKTAMTANATPIFSFCFSAARSYPDGAIVSRYHPRRLAEAPLKNKKEDLGVASFYKQATHNRVGKKQNDAATIINRLRTGLENHSEYPTLCLA